MKYNLASGYVLTLEDMAVSVFKINNQYGP